VNWLLGSVLCLCLVELIARLPFQGAIHGLLAASDKALHTVRARAISDHWKEKAMAAYARSAFLSTLKLALLLLAVAAVVAVLTVLFELGFSGFQSFLLSWQGIAFTLVFASLYVAARRALIRGRL
jgi:sterol desaturase/sphingolipid hydroxylase (fatty acid hydroxylase superfamily)